MRLRRLRGRDAELLALAMALALAAGGLGLATVRVAGPWYAPPAEPVLLCDAGLSGIRAGTCRIEPPQAARTGRGGLPGAP